MHKYVIGSRLPADGSECSHQNISWYATENAKKIGGLINGDVDLYFIFIFRYEKTSKWFDGIFNLGWK